MRSIAILTYHSLDDSGSVLSVASDVFAAQMNSLAAEGFHAMSLQEAVDFRERRGEWPDRAVVLTFDDGFASLHAHALPALDRHGFGATVFLVTGHMGGTNGWDPPPPRLGVQAVLSWDQAERLMECGVEVGAHGQRHVDLGSLGTDEAEREIVGCIEQIRNRLGRTPSSFAYPYGSVTPDVEEIAGRHFRACCTTVHGRTDSEPLSRLRRVEMYYFRNNRSLLPLASGRMDGVVMLRRWARSVRKRLTTGGRYERRHV